MYFKILPNELHFGFYYLPKDTKFVIFGAKLIKNQGSPLNMELKEDQPNMADEERSLDLLPLRSWSNHLRMLLQIQKRSTYLTVGVRYHCTGSPAHE